MAAIPVGILGNLAFAISDAASDRRLALTVAVLAGVAILTGGLSLARPGLAVVRASLFASLLWALGAGFVTAGGLPAAVAVITGMLALQHLRVRR